MLKADLRRRITHCSGNCDDHNPDLRLRENTPRPGSRTDEKEWRPMPEIRQLCRNLSVRNAFVRHSSRDLLHIADSALRDATIGMKEYSKGYASRLLECSRVKDGPRDLISWRRCSSAPAVPPPSKGHVSVITSLYTDQVTFRIKQVQHGDPPRYQRPRSLIESGKLHPGESRVARRKWRYQGNDAAVLEQGTATRSRRPWGERWLKLLTCSRF